MIQLAIEFRVTPNTISRWLHGDVKTVQDVTAQRVSQKIGYDISILLKGTEINFKKPALGITKARYDMCF